MDSSDATKQNSVASSFGGGPGGAVTEANAPGAYNEKDLEKGLGSAAPGNVAGATTGLAAPTASAFPGEFPGEFRGRHASIGVAPDRRLSVASRQMSATRHRSLSRHSTLSRHSNRSRRRSMSARRMSASSAEHIKSKHDVGWRRVLRNFTPSWFSVNMGTGIASILLHNLPYNAQAVRYISIVIFCLNIVMFILFLIITILRYILYPEIWNVMIKHPAQSLFLGCLPMGFATIINMMIFVCAPWGNGIIYLAWAFWWVDVLISCACSMVIPFIVVHHHRNQLSKMTAALLLPVVPVVVAAATGGIVAEALPNPKHAITTIVVSYILWGLGQAFSFFIMTVYFLRLQVHDLPPREVIVSVFLPVGPLGQGGFAIQQLGSVAMKLLPQTGAFNGVLIDHSETALAATAEFGGTVLYMFGILVGFFLWGAAVGWLAFAVMSIATTKHFPFNMGWWGFVFPLGVFTACTGSLGTELSSTCFKVLTMIFSASVVLLWILVGVKTVIKCASGNLINAPCLINLPQRDIEDIEDHPREIHLPHIHHESHNEHDVHEVD